MAGYFDKSGMWVNDNSLSLEENERKRKEEEQRLNEEYAKPKVEPVAQEVQTASPSTKTSAPSSQNSGLYLSGNGTYKTQGYQSAGQYDDYGLNDADKAQANWFKQQYAYGDSIGDQSIKNAAHKGLEEIRAKYGYSGGTDGSQLINLSKSTPTTPTEKSNDLYNLGSENLNYYKGYTDKVYGQVTENPYGTDYGKAILSQYKFNGDNAMRNEIGSGAGENAGNIDSYAIANAARQQLGYTNAGNAAVLNQYNAKSGNVLDFYGKLDTGLSNRMGDMQQNINSDRNFELGIDTNKKTVDVAQIGADTEKQVSADNKEVNLDANEKQLEGIKDTNATKVRIGQDQITSNEKIFATQDAYNRYKQDMDTALSIILRDKETASQEKLAQMESEASQKIAEINAKYGVDVASIEYNGTVYKANASVTAARSSSSSGDNPLTYAQAFDAFNAGQRSDAVLTSLNVDSSGLEVMEQNFITNYSGSDEDLYNYYKQMPPITQTGKNKLKELEKDYGASDSPTPITQSGPTNGTAPLNKPWTFTANNR